MNEQPQQQIPDFVLDLLEELKRSKYRPEGWLRFLGRSWGQSRAAARAHPALVGSWARVAAGLTLAEALTLALEARSSDAGAAKAALRAVPGAALWLASAQLDAYVHLGMNQQARDLPIYEGLGATPRATLAAGAATGTLAYPADGSVGELLWAGQSRADWLNGDRQSGGAVAGADVGRTTAPQTGGSRHEAAEPVAARLHGSVADSGTAGAAWQHVRIA